MNKIGGFGYCTTEGHTYVSLYQSDKGQCVGFNNHVSRLVPNLFDQINGNYILWILVKEVEKEL